MKNLSTIILIILIVMSLAAGAAKLMRTPDEAAFFEAAGLGAGVMLGLGALQVVAALIAALPKTRLPGLGLVAAGFLASTIIILMTGNISFALVSLLPVAFAGFVMRGARN